MLVQLDHLMLQGVLLILLFSSIIYTNIIHACDQTEHSSLLFFSLGLSSPLLNSTSLNCYHWEGITCNQNGWVTGLHLPSKGIQGDHFSSSLGNLTHLGYLNLSRNSLYGSLHQSQFFLSLNCLQILDLNYILLSEELPVSLLSRNMIRMVKRVDLSSNHFQGSIPSSFFEQARTLLVSELETIPSQVFRAGYNNRSGLLPEDMYDATTLEQIALPVNSLYGVISDRIINLTNLTVPDLSSNGLSNMLPIDIGKLSNLKFMLLHTNKLRTSLLPLSLMNCTNLIELNMRFNNFKGYISALNFSRFSQLTKLDIMSIITSLVSCQ
ncbi:hypothetical protein L3X38_030167 [Prunus dulcis]|uniref:Non-specific serine/threonine protein kinase n=1 Tax=Prunus dulcis TaxID=3755 RepID=A0AAD4YTS3_PRUDU|nr:hypothetical protein L3X38_030167 [Prunus dulcis]